MTSQKCKLSTALLAFYQNIWIQYTIHIMYGVYFAYVVLFIKHSTSVVQGLCSFWRSSLLVSKKPTFSAKWQQSKRNFDLMRL